MTNSKKLLSSFVLTAFAATSIMSVSSMTVSADSLSDSLLNDIPNHFIGVCGVFTGWGNNGNSSDIPMTDDDGDGIYEATVDLPSVDRKWLTEWNKDDMFTGEYHIQFKVRLDEEWSNNWGCYEPEHDRVFDSQCNLAIMEEVNPGDHIRFTVFFDTTRNNPDSVEAYKSDNDCGVPEDRIDYYFLYAGYKNFEKLEAVDYVPVESIFLDKTSIALGMSEKRKLNAKIYPANATNQILTWVSSDPSVVTVDRKGNLIAQGVGNATITASSSSSVISRCKITVRNAPDKITLTKGILTLGVGEKYTVGSYLNDGAACAKRTYRTSNSSIIKMTRTDWQGDFVAVKPGVAYVTVRTYNGKESTCKVTVKPSPGSVKISKGILKMKVGQTASLSSIIPEGTGCAERTFRTSNSQILKMTKTNWTGEFKALKPGVAYITVRTYNGKESACKVTVVK